MNRALLTQAVEAIKAFFDPEEIPEDMDWDSKVEAFVRHTVEELETELEQHKG